MRTIALFLALCLAATAPGALSQKKKSAPPKKKKPPVLNLELVAKDQIWCDISPRYRGWSADGKTIYYTHSVKDRTKARPICAYDIKTRKAKKC